MRDEEKPISFSFEFPIEFGIASLIAIAFMLVILCATLSGLFRAQLESNNQQGAQAVEVVESPE